MMKRFSLLCLFLVLFVGVAKAELFWHLDATNPSSLVTTEIEDPGDPNSTVGKVTVWKDLSGNERDATEEYGDVLYPSSAKFSGGFSGLDFQIESANSLLGLSQADAQLLLDSSSSDAGFSFVASVRPVDIGGKDMCIMGLESKNNYFGLVVTSTGDVKFKLQYHQLRGKSVLDDEGSYVLAGVFNPTGGSGNYRTWINNDHKIFTCQRFNYGSNIFKVGRANNNTNQYLDGAIGEIKFWNEQLSDEDMQYQRDLMARKWVENRAVSPLDGGEKVASAVTVLEWNNLLPENKDDDIYVDLYFGTEPDRAQMTKLVDNVANINTFTVDSSIVGEVYYWAVDTGIGQIFEDDDPNLLKGPIFSYTTLADAPPQAVDAGPDYITWPGEGVPVEVAVTDEGSATVTVTFTSDDPAMIFDPNPVVMDENGMAKTTATINEFTAVKDIVVTATAEDNFPDNVGITVSDDMLITLYPDACEASRQGNSIRWASDLAVDCVIDIYDFAWLAARWLDDYLAESAFLNPNQSAQEPVVE